MLEILNESPVDTFVLYTFLRKLTTPFEEWKAYKLGIIDKNGKTLRSRKSLITQEEKNAFTIVDVLVRNIKKIIEKAPGGKSKLASYLAGLYLIKEQNNAIAFQDEDIAYESFVDFCDLIKETKDFDAKCAYLIEQAVAGRAFIDAPDVEEEKDEEIEEDAPANSVAGGGIAGMHEPIVRTTPAERKKKKRKTFKESILAK